MEHQSIIGNCQYSALVGADGNVSWMCWPRFDSSFLFGNLVDRKRGGDFSVQPAAGGLGAQSYLTNTNVLRTRFSGPDGVFDVIDFAPRFFQHDRYYKPTMLIRVIDPVEGQPLIKVTCRPTKDYGAQALTATVGSNHIAYQGGEAPVRLTTDLSLTRIAEERPFVLNRRHYLVLTWGTPLEASLRSTCEDFLDRTVMYWRRWVKHCHLPEAYQRPVVRSALVLKLHQFEDTGAIIAATTSSIPEAPASERNWDYRYCWLRDAYFTVQALMRLSHFDELEGFERFLSDVLRASPGHVQPLYGIAGEQEITERTIDHLSGFQGCAPFRVGNAAYTQIQNDVYGQALIALAPLFTDIRFTDDGSQHAQDLLEALVEGIAASLDLEDAGIWEFRGSKRKHAFTMLMQWAGATAAAKAATGLGRKALLEKATSLASQARERMFAQFWNKELGTFTIAEGSHDLDASMLMAVNLGFLHPDDPRAKSTVNAIVSGLKTESGMLQRYRCEDDFGETTSCFTVCSLWAAEALARVGQLEEARAMFELVLSYQNATGLLSEDVEPDSGEQWGNFPQTYSHVGLINAAFALQTASESHMSAEQKVDSAP